MTFIVQSYFDTLLRYVLSVTFCGAVVMKVMDQKTLVKRRGGYKVRLSPMLKLSIIHAYGRYLILTLY